MGSYNGLECPRGGFKEKNRVRPPQAQRLQGPWGRVARVCALLGVADHWRDRAFLLLDLAIFRGVSRAAGSLLPRGGAGDVVVPEPAAPSFRP
jgi:hypothetical protein